MESAARARSCGVYYLQNSSERDAHPVGAAVELVAQREALQPALVEGARRLALEVDDHEVVAGVEHLAEVVVAMHPDTRRGQALGEKRAQCLRDARLQLQHSFRLVLRVIGQAVELAAQQLQRASRQPGEGLIHRTLVLA